MQTRQLINRYFVFGLIGTIVGTLAVAIGSEMGEDVVTLAGVIGVIFGPFAVLTAVIATGVRLGMESLARPVEQQPVP